MADSGRITTGTIQKYVTAIGTLHELEGWVNPTNSGSPELQPTLRGIECTRPDPPRRERRAFTVDLLQRMQWLHDISKTMVVMMFAAMTRQGRAA